MFKACYTLWKFHPWNFALNICLRYAESRPLIDLKMKKNQQSENYVLEVLISFLNFQIKVAHFTERVVFGSLFFFVSLFLSIK